MTTLNRWTLPRLAQSIKSFIFQANAEGAAVSLQSNLDLQVLAAHLILPEMTHTGAGTSHSRLLGPHRSAHLDAGSLSPGQGKVSLV